MGFWNNVVNELDYIGMTNKALAEKAGFDASNIGRGIRLNSSPSADTAVKIAKILNVSVEYLVTGTEQLSASSKSIYSKEQQDLFRKYSLILKKLDSLSENSKNALLTIIDEMNSQEKKGI